MVKERPNIWKYLGLITSIILMLTLSNFSETQTQRIDLFNYPDSNQISKPFSSQMSNITILIDGNTELEDFPGITGLGSSEDPYIIKNLQINASDSGTGIEIKKRKNIPYSIIKEAERKIDGLIEKNLLTRYNPQKTGTSKSTNFS